MSHTCHDQRYGPRSDTLADAQEQEIFNSAILTYPTRTRQVEGQLISTYHATQTNVLHLVRKHLTQPIEYEITRGEATPTRRQSQHYYHPGRIQDTNYHPSSSIARFNSLALCQTGSITCPWSLMQFGFVICLQKGLIFHCLHLIFTTFIC